MTAADLLTEPATGTGAGPDCGPELIERIRRGVIGDDEVLVGPYGPRRVTYADWTASATRSRRFPGAAPSPSSTPWASATWTTRWPGRRAAPRRSSSRSGPGWSWPSSRPSGPT
jgi:hypothetical protein